MRERFDPVAAETLAAGAPRSVIILELSAPALAAAVAAAVRAAGAVAAATGARVGVRAEAAQLAQAAAAEPGLRAEMNALADARRRDGELAPRWRVRGRAVDLSGAAQVMAIVNVSPDSFHQRVDGVPGAVRAARAFAAAGAALVDIGGRSYAHWSRRIDAAEEGARVVAAVAAVAAAGIDVALSVDTTTASVAEAALAAGAHAVNDCSGLADTALAAAVAKYDAGLVVMHLKGELNVRAPDSYLYGDTMSEIIDALYERTERARSAGVARDAIAVDPGLEFGKEPHTDLEILERYGELRVLGYPIVLASSRKSFMERVVGSRARELLAPSLATAAIGIAAGARIVRAHDVEETVYFARMLAAASGPAGESRAESPPDSFPPGGNSAARGAVST
ncbi:MAG: dihydropteroate synthase [Candidatus Velthaea sp.]